MDRGVRADVGVRRLEAVVPPPDRPVVARGGRLRADVAHQPQVLRPVHVGLRDGDDAGLGVDRDGTKSQWESGMGHALGVPRHVTASRTRSGYSITKWQFGVRPLLCTVISLSGLWTHSNGAVVIWGGKEMGCALVLVFSPILGTFERPRWLSTGSKQALF